MAAGTVVLVAAAAALTVRLAGQSTGTTAVPAGGLRATFVRTAAWDGGYSGEFLITNGGPAVNGWVLRFDLPSGERVANYWNGALSRGAGGYVVTGLSWNEHLGRGGAAEFGFQVESLAVDAPPTRCSLDGGRCGLSLSPGVSQSGPSTPPQVSAPAGAAAPTTTLPSPGGGERDPRRPFGFAPYVDATVDTPPFDLSADLRATGTRYFVLAFVVSQSGACRASWGGYHAVASGYYRPEISALRAAGGDVAIAFGGAAGTELADVCDERSLEAQYRSVVEEYKVTRVDFDIEGADLTDAAATRRRFEAVAALEAADPSLSVSVTLPVLPSGLDATALAVLHAALAAGARIDILNVMTMDYGDAAAPAPGGMMGRYAIEAAVATEHELAALYPGLDAGQLWRMLGVTPMVGVNDVADEVFGVSDAGELLGFADRVGLGRLSMWAATRDVPCAAGSPAPGSDTCSGITQRPWAFSEALALYGR